MNDILPAESPLWRHAEDCLREVLGGYGYREIRFPLLEDTALFERSIGDTSDIVQKEMYTFADRNGESVTLRPEGTAGCVRAALQHGLLHNQVQRLWYQGPMFRYEKPQKGRLRQFHQVGAEAFGLPGPDIDIEILLLTARLWRLLGLADLLHLEVNSLGTPACRERYRAALVGYFSAHRAALDPDSLLRLERNPLRILDSKEPSVQGLIHGAPAFAAYRDPAAEAHFQTLLDGLAAAGIPYRVNPRLVRGLDYYTHTVFEWVTEALGAQGTVCAGGRYDGLVAEFGGRATPGVGFALGLERLVALLAQKAPPDAAAAPHAYLVWTEAVGFGPALLLAEGLRDAVPGLRLLCHAGGGSLKSQMKRADQSGAGIALLLGEEEYASGLIQVKSLRTERPEERLPPEATADRLRALVAPPLAPA
jgi:histidyl-tRNA synthetase